MMKTLNRYICFFLTGFCLLFAGAGISPSQAETASNRLEAYYQSLNDSCQQDTDCMVKDVHNCCGYYPDCVNKEADVSALTVNKICARHNLASVCGFPSIKKCACTKGKCEIVPVGNDAPNAMEYEDFYKDR